LPTFDSGNGIHTDHGSKLKTEVHDSKGTGRVGCRMSGVGRHYVQQLFFSGQSTLEAYLCLWCCRYWVHFLFGWPRATGPVTQRSVRVFLFPFISVYNLRFPYSTTKLFPPFNLCMVFVIVVNVSVTYTWQEDAITLPFPNSFVCVKTHTR